MMSYAEVIKFRDHLNSFLKVAGQLGIPSKPEQFLEAVKFWRAAVPDSPILQILEKM